MVFLYTYLGAVAISMTYCILVAFANRAYSKVVSHFEFSNRSYSLDASKSSLEAFTIMSFIPIVNFLTMLWAYSMLIVGAVMMVVYVVKKISEPDTNFHDTVTRSILLK